MRPPALGPEHLAPACRAPSGGSDLLDRRPRLDQRHGAEWRADEARPARARRSDHARVDGARLRAGPPRRGRTGLTGGPVRPLATVEIEEVLLLLKIGFLLLLYLFIWRIVRTASRDLRAPQESFVLAPQAAAHAAGRRTRTGKLVVVSSPALREGEERRLDSTALTVGRSNQNDLPLDADEYASAQHARIEPRSDGVWIED